MSLLEYLPDPLTLEGATVRDNLLEFVLQRIPKRQAKIIRWVLLSNKPRQYVAVKLGISKTRVTQLVKQAIHNMQKVCKSDLN